MYTHIILRPAVAMIELIFAIVVIGIVLLTTPMLIQTSVNSNTVILQQESIAMLASHTNALMTFFWDEQNVNNPRELLRVTAGDAELQANQLVPPGIARSLRSTTPITKPTARLRSFNIVFTFNATSTLGLDSDANGTSTGRNDVDDLHDVNTSLILQTNPTYSKYIDQNITISTKVQYADGNTNNIDYTADPVVFNSPFNNTLALPNTSNIKLITTHLSTSNQEDALQKEITLYAFMCNIGGARPRLQGGK